MIKVLFADDEPKLLQAWERLFTAQPDMELVGTLPDAEGLADAAAALKPDIAVVDLSMPGRDPLDLLSFADRAERRTHPVDVDTERGQWVPRRMSPP